MIWLSTEQIKKWKEIEEILTKQGIEFFVTDEQRNHHSEIWQNIEEGKRELSYLENHNIMKQELDLVAIMLSEKGWKEDSFLAKVKKSSSNSYGSEYDLEIQLEEKAMKHLVDEEKEIDEEYIKDEIEQIFLNFEYLLNMQTIKIDEIVEFNIPVPRKEKEYTL